MNEIMLAKLRQDDIRREVARARRISEARGGERWWVRSLARLEVWTRRRPVLVAAATGVRRAR